MAHAPKKRFIKDIMQHKLVMPHIMINSTISGEWRVIIYDPLNDMVTNDRYFANEIDMQEHVCWLMEAATKTLIDILLDYEQLHDE